MMRKLRNNIFIFVSILLILPAIPLSLITSQLLTKSYQIGVNSKVETALDGSLQIAAEYYQGEKEKLEKVVSQIKETKTTSKEIISSIIGVEIPGAIFILTPVEDELFLQENIVPVPGIKDFINKKDSDIIWPAEDKSKFYALIQLPNHTLLQIEYKLSETFHRSAREIQEVNQIFKTLGLVQNEIEMSFLYTFLLIYGVGLIIALGVSFWFSKKITKPVEILKEAAKEIGKGNLEFRINLQGRNELVELGQSFNQMASELSENQRKIIELEKMTTWRQLARRLAHEIKNPLTPIQLMSQQMADNYKGDDEEYGYMVNECYSIIEQEVESLKNLVQEFSDFARLPEIHPVEQSINNLISSIRNLYKTSEVKIKLTEPDVMVSYDFDYMKRVLINLVDNAIAATPSKDPVEITVSVAKDKIQIEVIDKGEGIPEENLHKIFEPYFSTKRSGVGLGLSIVKKIVEEHGGKIEVITHLGQGTSFVINLLLKG